MTLSRISLKNKILFTILAAITVISVVIAFLTRWILVSSLYNELELRGSAIAHSIAERGGSCLLDKDYPRLLSLIFDEAKLLERERLVAYIFVTDQRDTVLSHTFVRPFPGELQFVRDLPAGEGKVVRQVFLDGQAVSDIAVPINEGLYRIGAVHVGLSQSHIDSLVAKLRITFLGFISLTIIILFLVSTRLSRHISLPITRLTRISDELSRGNFDISLDLGGQEEGWDASACPAYTNTDLPCWNFDDLSGRKIEASDPERLRNCRQCVFYRKREGDEVVQLADSFRNMVWSIKLYRRRLSESEDKYRSLFDSGPDPVFVVDFSTYAIIDANPKATELYGYAKAELVGKSFLDLGPESNHEFLAYFDGAGAGSACIYRPKMIHYRKGNRPFFVNVHACPTSYRGKPAIIIAVTDVTEMMEKDAQLIQASKMKSLGEMSAGIAHELNQPLNAIKMGSEFLMLVAERDLTVPKDQFAEVVREMSAQVDRAAEIIQTLRSFGRKAEMAREKLDLNVPVREVLTLVRRQFELENIHVDLELAEGLPPILAQDNRLQQVFFNLLTNARDAMNEKASKEGPSTRKVLSLKSYSAGGLVTVEVGDTGAGIPEANKDKIFEPFFTTKETGQGMGLGLAITYGIIKDYGGDIRIDSREGLGTTFRVSFPAA